MRRRIADGAERVVAHAAFAYGSIALLQVHALWGIGVGKDLTTGDTASYFRLAHQWATEGTVNIVWSPLYTATYGTLLRILGDIHAATLAHRVVSVLALVLVVLALARRFLAPWAAWAVAAWWAHLPIVYDALYEVHIFGAIPPLVAVLVAASGPPTVARRAVTIGVLAIGVALVRNEMAIAVAVVVAACIVTDRRNARPPAERRRDRVLVFGLPTVVTAAVVVVGIAGFHENDDPILDDARGKHTLNVCQVYAFNLQQRDEFDGDPWVGCRPLMEADFGTPDPSLVEAAVANPSAIAGFVAWNARLLPEGMQVSLFDATAGSANPDYAAVRTGRAWAGVGAGAVVAVLLAGALTVRSRPDVQRRLRDKWFPLVVAGGIVVTTLVVALTQRPRPSYLFPLSALVLVATLGSVQLLLSRTRVARLLPMAVPVATVLLLVLVPSHFRPSHRPMLQGLRALEPYADLLRQDDAVFVSTHWGELCAYLSPVEPCELVQWGAIRGDASTSADVARALADVEADVVYADEAMLADPVVAAFVAEAGANGWQVLDRGGGEHPYAVLTPA